MGGFSVGTYFHTQATVNDNVEKFQVQITDRVQKVELESKTNSRVLCELAISLKSANAVKICTKEGVL